MDIAGIPADLLISVYDDRVVIFLSANGKPGTLVQATVNYFLLWEHMHAAKRDIPLPNPCMCAESNIICIGDAKKPFIIQIMYVNVDCLCSWLADLSCFPVFVLF